MKTFLVGTVVFGAAARALGEPQHVTQVCLFAVARSKSAFGRMLSDNGFPYLTVAATAGSQVNDRFAEIKALRAAGLVSAEEAAIYVSSKNAASKVLRIDPGAKFTHIADLQWDQASFSMKAVTSRE